MNLSLHALIVEDCQRLREGFQKSKGRLSTEHYRYHSPPPTTRDACGVHHHHQQSCARPFVDGTKKCSTERLLISTQNITNGKLHLSDPSQTTVSA